MRGLGATGVASIHGPPSASSLGACLHWACAGHQRGAQFKGRTNCSARAKSGLCWAAGGHAGQGQDDRPRVVAWGSAHRARQGPCSRVQRRGAPHPAAAEESDAAVAAIGYEGPSSRVDGHACGPRCGSKRAGGVTGEGRRSGWTVQGVGRRVREGQSLSPRAQGGCAAGAIVMMQQEVPSTPCQSCAMCHTCARSRRMQGEG